MKPEPNHTVRPDVVLFPLDDEVVAFSERAQCLVSLNASAALVVRGLQNGLSTAEVEQSLVAEGMTLPEEAGAWVAAALEVAGSHGLLANGASVAAAGTPLSDNDDSTGPPDMPDLAPYRPRLEKRYRLLGTCALIRFSAQSQVRLVDAVIGHLVTEEDATPTVVFDLVATQPGDDHLHTYIYRDGQPIKYAPRLSLLGPIVKACLWQCAVNAHNFLFYIHAGVVGTGKACALFPAAAGSGKSSLTAALVHKGFRYFSDEVALIESSSFDVCPMPLAFCVKSTGWEVIAPYFPQVLTVPTHQRGDGKIVRYFPPPPGAVQQRTAQVTHIIFPRYDAKAASELKPLPRAEAFRRLMDECLALRTRLNLDQVRSVVETLSQIDCFTLTFSSLDKAVELTSGAVGNP